MKKRLILSAVVTGVIALTSLLAHALEGMSIEPLIWGGSIALIFLSIPTVLYSMDALFPKPVE